MVDFAPGSHRKAGVSGNRTVVRKSSTVPVDNFVGKARMAPANPHQHWV